ncbi:MAG: hypothetical protein JXQ29_00390, partial [Planctomycetes bacterium]|nr:hypothetical protein [Planctomycetota bacterium]
MSLRGRRPDPAPLDPAVLEDALGRGAARWPGVPVSHEKFRERLGRVLGPRAGDSPGVLEAIHVEDLYLVSALEAGSNEAWRTFVREFRPHVVQALARVLHDPREQDETADELLGGLLLPGAGAAASPLGTYSGRGGLRGWLQVSAIRRVYRRARRRRREGWVGLECEPAARAEEQPDARLGRTEALEALRKALPVALQALTEADRTLLRLRFERGFGLSELG